MLPAQVTPCFPDQVTPWFPDQVTLWFPAQVTPCFPFHLFNGQCSGKNAWSAAYEHFSFSVTNLHHMNTCLNTSCCFSNFKLQI